jgi:hypothetical protein
VKQKGGEDKIYKYLLSFNTSNDPGFSIENYDESLDCGGKLRLVTTIK